MTRLVYFSSVSGNTKRFVEKLGMPAHRIPLYPKDEPLVVDEDFVLMVPTYGGGNGRGACPSRSSSSSTTNATGGTSAA